MALTITVTKKSVTKEATGLFNISINLTCKDGIKEVINKDYSFHFHQGGDAESEIKKVGVQMQADINAYKASQVIFNHAKFDAGVQWLNTNLTG